MNHGIVAFLDFLGFRAMVKADAEAPSPTYLPRILETLDQVDEEVEGGPLGLTQFSDSVVLSSSFDPASAVTLLDSVRNLQRLFMSKQILVRGGIAFGRHHEGAGRLFSAALVTAYELESEKAIFPRVLVDPNLFDWLQNHKDLDETLRGRLTELILRDRDGHWFVDYLDLDALPTHRSVVESTLGAGKRSPSILAKAHWLFDYHNFAAGRSEEQLLDADLVPRFATMNEAN